MRPPSTTASLRTALTLALVLSVAGCATPDQPTASATAEAGAGLRFQIELTDEAAAGIAALGLETPVTGRAFVVLSRHDEREPRLQTGVNGVPYWGRDVSGLAGGGTVILAADDAAVRGYPLESLADLPAGDYFVQALLSVYTTFHRADGHTVSMHLNAGAGQDLWEAPGNVHSAVQKLTLDPDRAETITLTLDTVIPPLEPLEAGEVLQQGNPRDTDRVKFVKIKSEKLSAFWGRPMYIGANVLLPEGYDEDADVAYPVIYLQGHFPGRSAPFGFVEGETGRGRAEGFADYWTSGQAPGLIAVTFRDANPYYDTSYSVNSANVGPYGDALLDELMPVLEAQFRMIPETWARVLAGGSTGGWEALAMQIFYPDRFGGAWGWCPDPVDFNYYQIVNIYEDDNAYYTDNEWHRIERPNARRPDGNIRSTVRQENHMEYAAGPNSRSGGQWAIWEAVFGPVGTDGYPRPIWDPVTGVIDHETAAFWRANYDLHEHLRTTWETAGPQLTGKLHIAVGDMDSYYLDDAVYLLQDFLDSVDNPRAEASFEYGRRKPHCWIGASPTRPGEDLSNIEFIEIVADYLRKNAPDGADRRWLSE